MSSSSQSELERWKDKYFEQLEDFEKKEKITKETVALLQRLLVRVSLAAENVSGPLDQELDGLRSKMRSGEPEQSDLSSRLQRIDKHILSFDEARKDNAEKCVLALEKLIEQLQELDIKRKQKSKLKSLVKEVRQKGDLFKAYPDILGSLGEVQGEVLEHIVGDIPKEQGFFSRLLGGDKNQEQGSKEQSSSPEEQVEEETRKEDLEIEAGDEKSNDDVVIPGYYAIASHIQSTINHLLDQLVFPDSVTKDVQKLRHRIQEELNWYELAPTLDDLFNLVISVVGRGQRDFEKFLISLEDRLNRVQKFLHTNEASEKERQENSGQLDREVRASVESLSKDVSEASDIEELKGSINENLDRITQSIDRFSVEEQRIANDRDEQIKALQERLNTMEEEREHIRERLQQERARALTDGLTSLPNREAFDSRFELEFERWKRYSNPVSLVVADIDHFKRVNDTYGHLSGDKVLQIIAKEITKRIRKTDFLARFGGEEFVILLPETEVETAYEVMDKTRDTISRMPFHFKDEDVQITMSFGIVAFGQADDQLALFELADQALYKAKENGRNQVMLAKND